VLDIDTLLSKWQAAFLTVEQLSGGLRELIDERIGVGECYDVHLRAKLDSQTLVDGDVRRPTVTSTNVQASFGTLSVTLGAPSTAPLAHALPAFAHGNASLVVTSERASSLPTVRRPFMLQYAVRNTTAVTERYDVTLNGNDAYMADGPKTVSGLRAWRSWGYTVKYAPAKMSRDKAGIRMTNTRQPSRHSPASWEVEC